MRFQRAETLMRWPWVARSRLEVANRTIERLSATLRAERGLIAQLSAEIVEPQPPVLRVKPRKVSRNAAKYRKRKAK